MQRAFQPTPNKFKRPPNRDRSQRPQLKEHPSKKPKSSYHPFPRATAMRPPRRPKPSWKNPSSRGKAATTCPVRPPPAAARPPGSVHYSTASTSAQATIDHRSTYTAAYREALQEGCSTAVALLRAQEAVTRAELRCSTAASASPTSAGSAFSEAERAHWQQPAALRPSQLT